MDAFDDIDARMAAIEWRAWCKAQEGGFKGMAAAEKVWEARDKFLKEFGKRGYAS